MLLADYARWLDFLKGSRLTVRRYDRQLIQIGKRHPELSDLSNYLRHCMHHRSQFFGDLAIQLTSQVTVLRADPTNEKRIQRMTYVHPMMQALMTQLTGEFTDVDQSYRTLLPLLYQETLLLAPANRRHQHQS